MSGDQPDGMFKPFVGDTGTEIAAVQDLEEFDPFQVGDVSPTGKKNSPVKSRQRQISSSGGSVVSKGSTALPPRLDVMFKVHEEISSTPDGSDAAEGSSSMFVEGIVMVRNAFNVDIDFGAELGIEWLTIFYFPLRRMSLLRMQ